MKEYFDKNPESIPYLDRLEKEWREHGKIIIAVDFDDTISPWKMTDFNFNKVIDILIKAKATGAYIVIFSACSPERFPEIRDYCLSKGLEIDAINENPIPLPYGKNGKVYANIFIDDRAGLNESLQILEFAMYKIKGSKNVEMYDF